MSPGALTRAFQRILAVTLPVPAAVYGACSNPATTEPGDAGADRSVASSGTGSGSSGSTASSTTGSSAGSTSSSGGLSSSGFGCHPGFCSSGGNFEQFYVDSGPLDDAGQLIVDCAATCGDSAPWNCGACQEPMGWQICCNYCPPNRGACGRRPEGLLPAGTASGSPLGAHFAAMARLEAASVDAFRHLRRELVAHDAPRRLVRAAERAARDEIRHARLASALARRYGGSPMPAHVAPASIRSLEAVATENAVEGCVREAFGALLAHWQAACAGDPIIRAAMKRIARDETRHAALAFQVDAWAQGRLDARARKRVAEAREGARRDLLAETSEAPPALRGPLGLPTGQKARALAEQMALL